MNHQVQDDEQFSICLLTVLSAVLTAKNKWNDSAFNREDITFANACHAVRLALKMMEINKAQKKLFSFATDVCDELYSNLSN